MWALITRDDVKKSCQKKKSIYAKIETVIVDPNSHPTDESHPALGSPLRNWSVLQIDNNLRRRQHQRKDLASISNDSQGNDDWPHRVQTNGRDLKILR